MPTPSQEHFYIPGHKVASLGMKPDQVTMDSLRDLRNLGIDVSDIVNRPHLYAGTPLGNSAMDAGLQPTVTTPSITTLVQFLQSWLPGAVNVITAARRADELLGITTVGDWEDEEVVQTLLELTGTPSLYGDETNIPTSNWNLNFERRTIVRFEQGLEVNILEEKRAAKQRQDSAGNKRAAAALVLEVRRNLIAFYGFNDGENRTYGYLNDPSLSAFVTVAANQAGDTTWADKDAYDIIGDILTATSALRSKSGDTIDPYRTKTTMGVATAAVDNLSKVNPYMNISVKGWIEKTFNGNMRIVSAPELDNAHLDQNVFYLSADQVESDGSTDGGRVWQQIVPTKFMALGTQALAKGFVEDYSNATAGALCKRPYGVVRYFGI